MELIRGLYNLQPRHRSCVATIGSFDGVHLGHQAVIRSMHAEAARRGLPATLVTFEPMPREYFSPDMAPARLTRLREKLTVLARCDVERVLCLRFDDWLAGLPPAEFIQRVLVDGLGVQHLFVGDDFRFGRERAGNFASLEAAGHKHGFDVQAMDTVMLGQQRISSTRARAALEAGDFITVETLLGRPYTMQGRVAHGDKRGRTIGFPTANIPLRRTRAPLNGVFAVTLRLPGGAPLPGVANVGARPTVAGTRVQLEVHLFDFERDIYGACVTVEFRHKLRDEQRFDSLEALKAQIDIDAGQARAWFDAAG